MILFFPDIYEKPVLTGIVQAEAYGWNAKCASGSVPASGWTYCTTGPNVGSTPSCPGHGYGPATGLYGGSGSARIFNPGDVSRGL